MNGMKELIPTMEETKVREAFEISENNFRTFRGLTTVGKVYKDGTYLSVAIKENPDDEDVYLEDEIIYMLTPEQVAVCRYLLAKRNGNIFIFSDKNGRYMSMKFRWLFFWSRYKKAVKAFQMTLGVALTIPMLWILTCGILLLQP